jgi:hypothetical protein
MEVRHWVATKNARCRDSRKVSLRTGGEQQSSSGPFDSGLTQIVWATARQRLTLLVSPPVMFNFLRFKIFPSLTIY